MSCSANVSPSYKHAIEKNICPACGGIIVDKAIEDVANTISAEVKLKKEVLQKLATTIVQKYGIMVGGGGVKSRNGVNPAVNGKSNTSIYQQILDEDANIDETKVISARNVPEEIADLSEEERDRIMSEVVQKKYGLTDGLVVPVQSYTDEVVMEQEFPDASLFSEGAGDNILEQERLLRLHRQRQALQGNGKGGFRR